jgi:putative transposase
VNAFIDRFWEDCPKKAELLKPVVDSVPSWFGARMRKVAAREAIDMVKSAKAIKGGKPKHGGKRMCVSSTIAQLQPTKDADEFDAWLHLQSIGGGVILDLPARYHKHFNKLSERGKRLESYVITRSSVQLCFEIETGPKKVPQTAVGVDTGIKALASLSTGEQLGTDVEELINASKRKQWGSKGHKRALRTLRQRIDEVARDVAEKADVVVVEDLLGITHKTKRRLGKEMRRSVGVWNVRYWMNRLQARTEDNRVAFRRVPAHYTSQECSKCGHTDRRNRNGELFVCRACGHSANADVQASHNILSRFLSGPYGAGCKPATLTQMST